MYLPRVKDIEKATIALYILEDVVVAINAHMDFKYRVSIPTDGKRRNIAILLQKRERFVAVYP
jgi:hypothetical protein